MNGTDDLRPGRGDPPPRLNDPSPLRGANGISFGPDGLLYYPHMMSGEVLRMPPDGGGPETVVAGVPRPVAVRFDRAGELFVLSCDLEGTITRADPATPTR